MFKFTYCVKTVKTIAFGVIPHIKVSFPYFIFSQKVNMLLLTKNCNHKKCSNNKGRWCYVLSETKCVAVRKENNQIDVINYTIIFDLIGHRILIENKMD